MTKEERQCQNCKNPFTIEPEDFGFYEKMQVPPPTWCPDCRMLRRMIWRNERGLYRDKCGLCGKNILSMYSGDRKYPVYCRDCWWSDKWDPLSFGRELDTARPFLEQFRELDERVPRMNLWQVNVQNSDFANFVRDEKEVYLSYSVIQAEDIYYSKNVDNAFRIFDSLDVHDSENCYQCVKPSKDFNCRYAVYSRNCMDSAFTYDCVNCTNCFMSSNLRNKEYYFRNQPHTREEYLAKLKEVDQGSWNVLQGLTSEFRELVRKSLNKYAQITASTATTGNDLENCKNVHDSFNAFDMENVRFAVRCLKAKDSMDITNIGRNTELIYESVSGGAENSNLLAFASNSFGGMTDGWYTDYCHSSSHLFGCVGLRNKQYCILNKQYTKEEYEALVPRVIEHMNNMPYTDQQGRIYKYGEFFPPEFSPFAYNETIAQEYFPLAKAEALERGYRWKEPDAKDYAATRKPEDLPDHIKDVKDDILQETVGCAHAAPPAGGCNHQCTVAFKIIPKELEFYRRSTLPLPRLCPNCRHYERLAQRNPIKLWHRQCMCDRSGHNHSGRCPNEFETSYAPERPEIVYCEQCYNAEVA